MKKIILISGKIDSGKNTFAKFLGEELKNNGNSVVFDLFAKDVKDNCSEDFRELCQYINNEVRQIKGMVTNEFYKLNGLLKSYGIQNNISPKNILKKLSELTTNKNNFYEDKTDFARILLQIYGTDIFRNRVDDNYWIDRLKNRINSESHAQYIIITDVRFPNEINELYSDDWELIVINIKRNNRNKHHNHTSETSLDGFTDYHYYIDNNDNIYTLKESAKKVFLDIIGCEENNDSL